MSRPAALLALLVLGLAALPCHGATLQASPAAEVRPLPAAAPRADGPPLARELLLRDSHGRAATRDAGSLVVGLVSLAVVAVLVGGLVYWMSTWKGLHSRGQESQGLMKSAQGQVGAKPSSREGLMKSAQGQAAARPSSRQGSSGQLAARPPSSGSRRQAAPPQDGRQAAPPQEAPPLGYGAPAPQSTLSGVAPPSGTLKRQPTPPLQIPPTATLSTASPGRWPIPADFSPEKSKSHNILTQIEQEQAMGRTGLDILHSTGSLSDSQR